MHEIVFGKGRETNIYGGYNAHIFFRRMITVSSSNLLLYKILLSFIFLPAILRSTSSFTAVSLLGNLSIHTANSVWRYNGGLLNICLLSHASVFGPRFKQWLKSRGISFFHTSFMQHLRDYSVIICYRRSLIYFLSCDNIFS